MVILERIGFYFQTVLHIASDPVHIAILFGSVILGIMFGAMPGLTSTLGVALLTALTYGMDTSTAMLCLLAIYVGGTYGGSYASILINIPGTAGGSVNMLNNKVLANSDFYTGAFPAEYGNALAGVFDLKFRNGNNQRRHHR